MAKVTAFLFKTGSTPGMPVQTGQVLALGGAPNFVEQLQNIFVSVFNWGVDFKAYYRFKLHHGIFPIFYTLQGIGHQL